MVRAISAVCVMVAVIGAAPAFGKTFENGDFSTGPSVGRSGFTTVVEGTKKIQHWIIGSNSVDYITTYWQNPPGATASIDMDGSTTPQNENSNQAGTLAQSFTTTVGTSYSVSFYFSGNPHSGCGPRNKKLEVLAGPNRTSFVFNIIAQGNSVEDMKWVQETVTFVATHSISRLQFASKTTGFCGPAIGEVTVTPSS